MAGATPSGREPDADRSIMTSLTQRDPIGRNSINGGPPGVSDVREEPTGAKFEKYVLPNVKIQVMRLSHSRWRYMLPPEVEARPRASGDSDHGRIENVGALPVGPGSDGQGSLAFKF